MRCPAGPVPGLLRSGTLLRQLKSAKFQQVFPAMLRHAGDAAGASSTRRRDVLCLGPFQTKGITRSAMKSCFLNPLILSNAELRQFKLYVDCIRSCSRHLATVRQRIMLECRAYFSLALHCCTRRSGRVRHGRCLTYFRSRVTSLLDFLLILSGTPGKLALRNT